MKITDLKFDPKNANLGTERGRKALAASLKQFGDHKLGIIARSERMSVDIEHVDSRRGPGAGVAGDARRSDVGGWRHNLYSLFIRLVAYCARAEGDNLIRENSKWVGGWRQRSG